LFAEIVKRHEEADPNDPAIQQSLEAMRRELAE
jgi:hypothetical protein